MRLADTARAEQLERERVELRLSEAEKAGASQVFFTKVKEELHIIPAQFKVIEYWQEKAVFDAGDGQQRIVAAPRPVHPLGKCCATPAVIAYLIAAKYADGLPLYRLEQQFKRLGQTLSRSSMAHWIIDLDTMLRRLVERLRSLQNRGDYLQADGYAGYAKVCRDNAITRIGCWDHYLERSFIWGKREPILQLQGN